jgi:hypothetical protein
VTDCKILFAYEKNLNFDVEEIVEKMVCGILTRNTHKSVLQKRKYPL